MSDEKQTPQPKQPLKEGTRKRTAAPTRATTQKEAAKPRKEPTRAAQRKPAAAAKQSEQETQSTSSAHEEENSIEQTVVPMLSASPPPARFFAGGAAPLLPGSSNEQSESNETLLPNIARAARGFGKWILKFRALAGSRTVGFAPKGKTSDGSANSRTLSGTAGEKSKLVPEVVLRRFLKVEHDFFFSDRTPAFSDRGNKLATRGAHPDVVKSLIEIAKAREWDSITVKGTKEFRRSAWLEAAQNGLKVVGYEPNTLDLAVLSNRPMNNSVERSLDKEIVATSKYPFGAVSQAASVSRPAAVRSARSEAASKAQGVNQDPELMKKAKAFEKNKPAFVVKKYPDLVGAYGIVEAAKTFAAEKLPEAAHEPFVEIARQHVMHKIAAGTEVKGPRIYASSSKVHDVDKTTKSSPRGSKGGDKAQRSNEPVRER